MQRITSRQNAIVTQYREVARGHRPDVLLLDGTHLVRDALAAGLHLRHVMVAAAALDDSETKHILEQLDLRTVTVAAAADAVMDAVSPVQSSSPVVALATRPDRSRSVFDAATPMVVIICDVQDPGNVGAIIRVAEGAGASGVIVAGQSADPFGWKALRGSMGSALRLPLAIMPDVRVALDDARAHAAQVVATVPRGGISLFDARLAGATALLIGGEGLGLADALIAAADVRVTIPMESPVESLNAAVAAAILLYEARRQRSAGVALAR